MHEETRDVVASIASCEFMFRCCPSCLAFFVIAKVVEAAWTPNAEALPYLAFVACPLLPPFGTAVLTLRFPTAQDAAAVAAAAAHVTRATPVRRAAAPEAATFNVSAGGGFTLTFSNASGLLVRAAFVDLDGGEGDVSADLSQQWGYYTSFDSGLGGLDLGTALGIFTVKETDTSKDNCGLFSRSLSHRARGV
jgi:hypothetical protein